MFAMSDFWILIVIFYFVWVCRSCCPEVFSKTDVIKSLHNSQKNTCVGVCFNKVVGLWKLTMKIPERRHRYRCGVFIVNFQRPATLLKEDSNKAVSLGILRNFLRTSFFIEHLQWLLDFAIFVAVRPDLEKSDTSVLKTIGSC